MSRKPTPPEILERVRQFYAEGLTYRAIAAKIGCSAAGVWGYLGKLGLRRQRPNRVGADKLARVAEVYTAGGTLTAAAVAAKCSIFSAWYHLKKTGLLRHKAIDGAAIAANLAKGLTAWETAKELGIDLQTVLHFTRKDKPQ